MQAELPTVSVQRRLSFRPDTEFVNYAYKIINRYVFDNALHQPEINLGQLRRAWGRCRWMNLPQTSGSWCRIDLSDKWFSESWMLNTLAHEMAHQYQWDVYRWDYFTEYHRAMNTDSEGHGPSFFMWRERFEYYGLSLRRSHSQRRWFRYQELSRS